MRSPMPLILLLATLFCIIMPPPGAQETTTSIEVRLPSDQTLPILLNDGSHDHMVLARNLNVVTHVQPTDPIQPTDPVRIHVNLDQVSGVEYRHVGAVERVLTGLYSDHEYLP